MSTPSNKISDIIEMVTTVKFLNHAVFMAAGDSGVTGPATDALQSVCDIIDDRLKEIDGCLDELMEELR